MVFCLHKMLLSSKYIAGQIYLLVGHIQPTLPTSILSFNKAKVLDNSLLFKNFLVYNTFLNTKFENMNISCKLRYYFKSNYYFYVYIFVYFILIKKKVVDKIFSFT